MRPHAEAGTGRDPRFHPPRLARWGCALVLIAGCQAVPPEDPDDQVAAPATTTASSSTSTTTTTSSTTPEVLVGPPPMGQPYVVPATEVAPEAKQLAVDLVHELTNYEESADHATRLTVYEAESGPALRDVAEPLTHPGSWSRGEVIYPQLGGLTADRASVMVVTRQTVGRGAEATDPVLRTIDVRLVRDATGWRFDHLASAGGAFESIDDLRMAHDVATDPRIEMPDSARLDILSGLVSQTLLEVMADLAEVTPYAVTVLATGHPHYVFETDRQSHHTVGRAVDIYRIGENLVIDDHDPLSGSMAAVRWMYNHPDVVQVGSPWDLDGAGSSRSFTNTVHLDHIHLAVKD